MAGKRLGLLDQPLVHQAVTDLAGGRDTRPTLLSGCRDARSLLAAEPMRYLHALHQAGQPEWVAMEEVPDVLPLWRQYAQVLRGWGFSVWTGIVNAADYGVPQTRRRAILLASRVRTAAPPPPTHAAVAEPDTLFGPARQQWVSMAQALGWGATDRPVPTVCAGGGPGGGPEPFPSGSRKALAGARARGRWRPFEHSGTDQPVELRSRRDGPGWTASTGSRDNRSANAPAPTFTAEAHRWSWSLRTNSQAHSAVRRLDQPAGTLFFGHRSNQCLWVPEPPRPDRAHIRPTAEPDSDPLTPDTADAADAADAADSTVPEPIRITAAEAGILQTFPADYPWAGNKSQQFTQIGNAVPPLLAGHLLAEHLGATLNRDDFTLAA
jgi:DNA (cytosine-5)-methyltransferase 1